MSNRMLPPTSLVQVIGLLATLSNDQFDDLRHAVQGKRSFDLSAESRSTIAKEISWNEDSLSYVLSALMFLYNQLEVGKTDAIENVSAKVNSMLSDLKIATKEGIDIEVIRSRLSSILSYNKNHELYSKIARLEAGFIASVTGLGSFVDLRPSFDLERTMVEGFVPIIQLNISTDSPRNHESNIVVQLDTGSLKLLKSTIEDVERKLALLTTTQTFLPILTTDE